MKKWMFRVACLLAFAFSPAAFVAPPAQAQVVTTKYTLTAGAWTDLGVGPVLVSPTGRIVFAVADTTPSLVAEGFSVLPGASFTFNTASHVWARSLDGISPFVYASPILASGGSGSGGGTITAGTTLTSGFTAGQMMVSDGAKIQNTGAAYTQTNWGTVASPMYFTAFPNGPGGYNHFSFTNGTADQAGISIFPAPYTSVQLPAGGSFVINSQSLYGGNPGGDVWFSALPASSGGSTAIFYYGTSPTVAENLRVYNNITNFTNGEWAAFDWTTTANVLTIGAQANGTGTVRGLNFVGASVKINGTAAVNCAAGAVSTATMIVTNGIVTHC